jgi:hypothetical protein
LGWNASVVQEELQTFKASVRGADVGKGERLGFDVEDPDFCNQKIKKKLIPSAVDPSGVL